MTGAKPLANIPAPPPTPDPLTPAQRTALDRYRATVEPERWAERATRWRVFGLNLSRTAG